MPKQAGRGSAIVNVRIPNNLYDEFAAEAGEGYGARSDLFRRMLLHWLNSVENHVWEARYKEERARRIALERQLERIRQAVNG